MAIYPGTRQLSPPVSEMKGVYKMIVKLKVVLTLGALLLAAQAGVAREAFAVASTTKATNYCPMIYAPVTAITRDGRCVRFANSCLASLEGATVVPDGTCGFRSFDQGASGGAYMQPAGEGLPLPWPFAW